MEDTTNGDDERELPPPREREDDIRTEFERMMFEFNPEDNTARPEPEVAPKPRQAPPAADEPPAYN